MTKEERWVKTITTKIERTLRQYNDNLRVSDGKRLAYSYEILNYIEDEPEEQSITDYETDILVYEILGSNKWKPRVVIEAKIDKITTHDVITYSQKSLTHKNVHPYLRYGILIGNHGPLPGRIFRHGQHFDFMMSWKSYKSNKREWKRLIEILKEEIGASKTLDKLLFDNRNRFRDKFTSLHRPLKLS
ncbi:MAG: hypothetical protein FJ218_07635 [Ignavibacteria bacterium]|nr:hypothetical protein [Ignavibacteria bacterium]